MAWATPQDAQTRLGRDLTEAELALGQSIIEDLLDIDETDSAAWLKARDLRRLKRATLYQAAHLADNPGVLEQRDMVSYSQPDLSVVLKAAGVGTLPPWMSQMAARVMAKLSFAGTRSVRLESELTRPDLEDEDDEYNIDNWTPL